LAAPPAIPAPSALLPVRGLQPNNMNLDHFVNPIVHAVQPAGAADPSVVFHDGWYYYCKSLCDNAIGVARAARLQDIGRAPMVTVWRPPAGTQWSEQVWAPELQRVRGRWVIYFAASDGHNHNHRMYALESSGDDLQQGWRLHGKVADASDCWAIDGLTLEHAGALFHVWSGWRGHDDGFPQVLYLAPMSDAFTICGERIEIAAPEHDWECRGAPLLEGPALLQRDGRTFLAYSASASWSDDYAVGLLSFDGRDMRSPRSWVKAPQPVLARHAGNRIYGPGHNSFTTSPDGREDWIVYHAIDQSGGGWSQRSVRAQRFGWSAEGAPVFDVPTAAGCPIREPSGTPALPLPASTRLLSAWRAAAPPPR
jgi:GH43 family beta-xylosidase